MAALAPLSATPARQPFGILDGSRLSKLSSVKNRQNGITSTPSSLKRRHASPELSDSENVDPSKLSSKRKRSAEDNEDDLCKPSKYPINNITLVTKPRIISPTSVSSSRIQSPRLTTSVRPIAAAPSSAPAAAGRSPTSSKRAGLLSRSRRGLGRVESPSFKARNAAPKLSLSAALNGTMAYSKPQSKPAKHVATLEESVPKSWEFEIHEDTPEEEMVNLMGHSTCVLDISDDESKSSTKDDRGKENVPPMDMPTAITIPSPSRRDAMSDEARTPLGDLKAEDFYAEGCDATSIIVISGDDADAQKSVTSSIDNIIAGSSSKLSQEFTVECSSASASLLKKAELDALIFGSPPQQDAPSPIMDDDEDAATDIEIWESGSANDEAIDGENQENIFTV